MGRLKKNLTGVRFGRWTVIKLVEESKPIHWECVCDCGTKRNVASSELLRSATKSCGCLKSPDLTGKKFGKLTVVEKGYSRPSTKGTRVFWKCLCECGNITYVITHTLNNGHTKSCGCLAKYQNGEASFNNLYYRYKKSAKIRGLSFEITRDKFREMTHRECFYCGEYPSTLHMGTKTVNGGYLYNGIDRVDNSKGYTNDNVVSCCVICNRAKLDHSMETFFDWLNRIYTNYPKIKNKLEDFYESR